MTHPIPDEAGAVRPMRWLGLYCGRAWNIDFPLQICVAFMVRADLMTKPEDEGMLIPVALEIGLITGQSPVAKMDGRLDGWIFRPWLRCDAPEIARRLAGGDE